MSLHEVRSAGGGDAAGDGEQGKGRRRTRQLGTQRPSGLCPELLPAGAQAGNRSEQSSGSSGIRNTVHDDGLTCTGQVVFFLLILASWFFHSHLFVVGSVGCGGNNGLSGKHWTRVRNIAWNYQAEGER